MFLLDDVLVHSASDLTAAAACEYAVLRRFDELLGRRAPGPAEADPLMDRVARLGDAHEQRELARHLETFGEHDPVAGTGVHVVRRGGRSREQLEASAAETLQVLRGGADVVAQAAFFDGTFVGYADFLVREPDGSWSVWDTKLARHVRVASLLQLAAYAQQLARAGLPVARDVHLRLGDRTSSTHRVDEVLPVLTERRSRLLRMLDEHRSSDAPAGWDDGVHRACGRCGPCTEEVHARRDVLLVAGLRASQRVALRAPDVGVRTIDELAVSTGPVDGVPARTLAALRHQAALQVRQRPPDGEPREPSFELLDGTAIGRLPAPDPGDVYFDFEGDPLWAEDEGRDWGLEYLFGVLEPSPSDPSGTFRAFWAHDRAQEKQALVDFLAYVEQRRARHPGMHVYHYAPYERTALLRLAGRHGVGEDAVDELLRAGVLVDLYATVRHSIRVSQPSYGLKYLEPLYMGDDLRGGDDDQDEVTTAGDSIVMYQLYAEQVAAGDDEALATLGRIADYNEMDCLSTWRLDTWLRGLVPPTAGPAPTDVDTTPADARIDELAPLVDALTAHAGEPGSRSDDEQAVAMVAASLAYHRREAKPFWWGWFDRLSSPVDEWADTRDAFVVERTEVREDWQKPPTRGSTYRVLALHGRLEPGSGAARGRVRVIYDDLPPGVEPGEGAVRAVVSWAKVQEVEVDERGRDVVVVHELLPKGAAPWSPLPSALCAAPGPHPTSAEEALLELARDLLPDLPDLPAQPALELLRRRPPEVDGGLPEVVGDDHLAAVTAAVRGLRRSYLAVQGPPGTGKTYVGARVVAALVADGWKVGVVAQSHAVVENLLEEVVVAGVDPALVAKPRPAGQATEERWASPSGAALATFLDDHDGCVVGGTLWTFTNPTAVARGRLDLLVVEEAGQFSLANTLAVSVAAERLLLLGDPQQLPQVSQGSHPEPVDGSALGWLADGHETLPPDLGYFLPLTRRMRSELCAPVSALSYEGRLRSRVEDTDGRVLDGVPAGVRQVVVDHDGATVESPEEADEVVRLVRDLVGRTWHDGDEVRPLLAADVLVVAPYNAQVATLRRALDDAGLGGTEVGTVDKFQGREAAVVVVSMTASDGAEIPRGVDFLLDRNRLNVAVSRGQHTAYVVRARSLTDFLPTSPDGLVRLGGFLRLCGPGVEPGPHGA